MWQRVIHRKQIYLYNKLSFAFAHHDCVVIFSSFHNAFIVGQDQVILRSVPIVAIQTFFIEDGLDHISEYDSAIRVLHLSQLRTAGCEWARVKKPLAMRNFRPKCPVKTRTTVVTPQPGVIVSAWLFFQPYQATPQRVKRQCLSIYAGLPLLPGRFLLYRERNQATRLMAAVTANK